LGAILNYIKLFLFLLLLGLLLPNHYSPWSAVVQQVVCGFFALLIGLWVLLSKSDRPEKIPVIAVVAAALAPIPLAQWAGGAIPFRVDAFLPAIYLLAFGLSIAVGARLVSVAGGKVWNGFFSGVLAVAGVSVVLQLFQWQSIGWLGVFLKDLPFLANSTYVGRPYANIAQPSQLAVIQCLGMLAVVYLYEMRRWGGAVCILVLAWLTFGLVMTRSRSGLVIAALTAVFWFAVRLPAARRTRLGSGVVLVVAMGVATVTWPQINDFLLLSLPETFGQRMASQGRDLLWPAMWTAVWQHPWLGWGVGQVARAQQAVASAGEPGIEMVFNAHNLLLDLMLWCGIPFAVVSVTALAAWFVRRARQCADISALTLMGGVLIIGLYALLEFPYEYLYFLIPLGLMMGGIEAPQVASSGWRVPKVALWGLWVSMAAALTMVVVEYATVESADRDARMAMARVGYGPGHVIPPPDVWLLDGPREFHRFRFTEARPGMSEDELVWMNRVVMRYPYPPALFRLALAQGLNGHPVQAREHLRGLCNTNWPTACDEAGESWREVQRKYPQLRDITMPQPSPH